MTPMLNAMVGLALTVGAITAQAPTARVRVIQRDLVPQCLNGRPIAAGVREWHLPPGPVSLTFTMRIDPRPGQSPTTPGTALVAFTAESNRRYEVEVRADPMAFSTRAWRAREWTPVVRDRTTDQIVSGEPQWLSLDRPAPGQPSSASSRVTSASSCAATARTVDGSPRSTPARCSSFIG